MGVIIGSRFHPLDDKVSAAKDESGKQLSREPPIRAHIALGEANK